MIFFERLSIPIRPKLCTIFIVLFASLLLNSCATNTNKTNDYRLNKITDINNEHYWKMQGRMSVRLQNANSETINISWIQAGERLTIEFTGSFGLGSHVIKVQSDGKATITSSKLNESADSLEALWTQFSPIPLPIEAFSYWIKGLSHPFLMPTNIEQTITPKSRQFTQQNWNVNMSKYVTRKDYDMPNKIKLSNGIESATLLIESWTFY